MADGKKMMLNQVETLMDDQPLNPYTEIQILHDHNDLVKFLLPIDDDKFLSVADDNTAILWDISTAVKICTLSGHTRPITCATLLKPPTDESQEAEMSDYLLLTGSSDKTIRIWSTETGSCREIITEHSATTKAILSFSNSGLFCTGGQDLFLWSSSGRLLHCVPQEAEADIKHLMAIGSDRFVVAAGAGLDVYGIDERIGQRGITVFQLKLIKRLVPQHREAVMCLTVLSDAYFASASLDGTVKVWNTHTLATSRQLNHIKEYEKNGFPWCVQHMLPLDGKHLCISIGSGLAIFDILTGDCLWRKACAHYSKITFISVVYGGKFLATCSEDGTIRLWGPDPRLRGGDDSPHFHDALSLHNFGDIVNANQQHQVKETRRLFRREESKPAMLCLQGECVAHSGAVQMLLDYQEDGMASCGVDGLVILWKDGVCESSKRNQLIREMLQAKNGLF